MNSLISGYLQAEFLGTTIELLCGMPKVGIMPSAFGVSTALLGCTQLFSSQLGIQIHGLSLKCGFSSNLVLRPRLVDMFAK